MKNKLYIHIGFAKTGTSTIQKFLYTNRNYLRTLGLCYPDPFVGQAQKGNIAHLRMSECDSRLRYDKIPWSEYRDRYYRSLLHENAPINILSAESFSFDRPDIFTPFQRDFDIKIICYFRNIFDYSVSLQKQLIKEGLRPDAFELVQFRNAHILANVESYIDKFGRENCHFVDYDSIGKENSILNCFFKILNIDVDFQKCNIEKVNVTPCDAVVMFLYQLSFLPFNRAEWNSLRDALLKRNYPLWESFHSSFLSSKDFLIDGSCEGLIIRQGELLNDKEWLNKTKARGEQLAMGNMTELPLDIQKSIFESLPEEVKRIICKYWSVGEHSFGTNSLLPSLKNISEESFFLLKILRKYYVICHGNNRRLKSILASYDKEENEKRERLKKQTPIGRIGTALSLISEAFHSLLSSSFHQINTIKKSNVFDEVWYIEQYTDLEKNSIDPVKHYFYYGAKEGRDPAPWFSTSAYLQANPDVQKTGLNPFYHYIRYGFSEGRKLC